MPDTAQALEDFVAQLDEKIDILVGINNKVDFTSDYDTGYKDASVAIKNTARTILNQMIRGINES